MTTIVTRYVNVSGAAVSRVRKCLGVGKSIVIVVFSVFLYGCTGGKEKESTEDILLSFDDKVLTLNEVIEAIPVGIDPVDSVALFEAVVDSWIKSAVIGNLAEEKLPDLDEIDRKVEAYRNRLIVAEYLGRMRESHEPKVSEESIRGYYDAHKEDLLTESPLVKGIYIKLPSNTVNIDEIKRLLFSGRDKDIDELEKNWMDYALQYDYFGSSWIDFRTLAEQIPYRFYDADAFLKSTSDFETTYNGTTYLFHISGYLPSGSRQPYEFAAKEISDILEQSKLASYEESLVSSLIKKAMKEDRLVAVGYDPLRHVRIINKQDQKIKEQHK